VDPNRLYVDSVDLRHVAGQINGGHGAVEATGKALSQTSIDLPPDDPLRTHLYFLSSFSEFTTSWGREITYIAEAITRIAQDMDGSAELLVQEMCSIAKDLTPLGVLPQ
jgi:hypothetical protein